MLFFSMRKLIGISVALAIISGCVALPAWLSPGLFSRKALIVLGLFLTVFLLGYAAWQLDEVRRRRCREVFLRRSPMPDETFLAEMQCDPAEAAACLAVRAAMADEGGIPSSVIYPSDTMASLAALQFDGLDVVGLIMQLEQRLETSIPDVWAIRHLSRLLPTRADWGTIAEFAVRLARELNELRTTQK